MIAGFSERLAEIEGQGRVEKTPCGDGHMVWHAFGNESREPLVLLHGGFGSWTHWVKNVLPLSEHFYVLAADTPGIGDSDMPPEPATMDSVAEIISLGIDTLISDRVPHICGFSFGSVLGALAAALRDGRTASYTMVGAGNRGLGVRRGIMEPLLKQTPEMTDEERHEVHFENLARLMFKHRKNIDEFAIWLQMRNVPRTRIKSRRMEGDNNQRDAIERIDCPVNAIWGDGDATAHPYWDERREVLREVHPDVELHLVPEAGHWVAYEATDVLNDLLIRLLKAVPDRPGRRGG